MSWFTTNLCSQCQSWFVALDDKSTAWRESLIRFPVTELENFSSLVATHQVSLCKLIIESILPEIPPSSPASKIIDAFDFKICSLALSVFDVVPNFLQIYIFVWMKGMNSYILTTSRVAELLDERLPLLGSNCTRQGDLKMRIKFLQHDRVHLC